LVSVETFRLTQKSFEYSAPPPRQMGGWQYFANYYQLIGPREESERYAEFEQISLIGRRSELAKLISALSEAIAGRPQLVSVVGEAGIGKSRLIHEFQQHFINHGLGLLLRGRGLSYLQDAPYAMINNILTRYLSLPAGAAVTDIDREMRRFVETYRPVEVSRQVALLAYLIGTEIPHPEVSSLLPQQKRVAAFFALNELLLAMARRYTVLLSLEDLHLADEASLEWFSSLVEQLAAVDEPLSLLIVCQYRSREAGRLQSLNCKIAHGRIVIGPLESPEAHAYISAYLNLATAPENWPPDLKATANRVIARAEGNPLFLKTLLLALKEQEFLVCQEGEWHVTRSPSELQLPDTINYLVLSRLDHLPAELKNIIAAAAILGRTFHPRLLEAMLGRQDLAVALIQLAKMGFLRKNTQGEYIFDHGVTHEVTYQSMPQATRRELHYRAGEALEKMLGAQWESSARILAYHFSQGHDAMRAARYFMVAGKQAYSRFANKEALSCFRQVLALISDPAIAVVVSKLELLKALAEVETILGEHQAAIDHLEAALPLACFDLDRADLQRRVGVVLERKGEFKAALRRYKQAIGYLDQEQGGWQTIKLLLATARLLLHQGDAHAANTLTSDVLLRLAGQPPASEAAEAHELIGDVLFMQSRWHDALSEHTTALAIREELQDQAGIASSKSAIGMLHVATGELHQATSLLEEAIHFYSRCGDLFHLAEAQNRLGEIFSVLGDTAMAERLQRSALSIFRRIGSTCGEAHALVALGNSLAAAEQFATGKACLQEGLKLLEEIDAIEQQADAFASLARIALAMGLEDESLGFMQRALKMAEATDNRLAAGIVYGIKAELLVSGNFKSGAHEASVKALNLLEPLHSPLELGRAKLIKAKVDLLSGNLPTAIASFKEAVGIFAKIGAKPDLHRAEDMASLFESATAASAVVDPETIERQ
ncbi:MAG: AAA family ATPase, partial [Cyanobacteria bacterium NC_groundwater_1444_Ag_S-0.65um_54_12]|nr:AAA family ATPase [Cyanobacteria bacterium NC_groundwater_1444_Ag_S-0.65um_54_12]